MKNDDEPRKKSGARAHRAIAPIALLAIAAGASLLSCNNPFWSQSARDDVAPELTMEVTIGGAPVNGPVRLAIDGSVTLTATVSPADATVEFVLWEILDGDIAGLGQSGSTMTTENPFEVTARNPGETTITATAIISGAGPVTVGITVEVSCACCAECGSSCDCATEGACGAGCSCRAPSGNFVRVRGGTFLMGYCPMGPSVTPMRDVTLSGFYISRFQVTQGEWYDVMYHLPAGTVSGTRRPSSFNGTNISGGGTATPTFEWRNLPVERVNWYEAIVFANRLSIQRGLTPAYSMRRADDAGYSVDPADWGPVPTSSNARWNAVTMVPGSTGYRLPTEAQWEFAARGGIVCEGNYAFSGSNNAAEVAWHSGNRLGARTHEVGMLEPNALGLYDMSGNVREWVWDRWGAYPSHPETDPTGAAAGDARVDRGGGWNDAPGSARSAFRIAVSPVNRNGVLGFRVVRP